MRALESDTVFIPAGTPHHVRGFVGGLYSRPFGPVSRGYTHTGHRHYIDHNMMVVAGTVRVEWHTDDGRRGVVRVQGPRKLGDLPTQVPILAGAHHTIIAEEDGTVWLCVFAEAEADKLGDADGPVPFHLEKPDV